MACAMLFAACAASFMLLVAVLAAVAALSKPSVSLLVSIGSAFCANSSKAVAACVALSFNCCKPAWFSSGGGGGGGAGGPMNSGEPGSGGVGTGVGGCCDLSLLMVSCRSRMIESSDGTGVVIGVTGLTGSG